MNKNRSGVDLAVHHRGALASARAGVDEGTNVVARDLEHWLPAEVGEKRRGRDVGALGSCGVTHQRHRDAARPEPCPGVSRASS